MGPRAAGWLALLWIAASACSESLPTRLVPQAPLEISRVLIGQGTGPAGIEVSITAEVRNTYEETFDGDVDILGNARIWWVGRPEIEANLPVRQTTHLRLDPSQRHILRWVWHLQTDDGRNVMSLLDFSGHDERYGVLYARPETFALEVAVTVFRETGLLRSGPHEFALEGWKLAGESDGPPQP
ncbi:MAG: hypothetical protein ABIL09_13680 [Gemmatimonadota bacterium]